MQTHDTKQSSLSQAPVQPARSTLSAQLSDLRAETVLKVNNYWREIEPYLERPESLTNEDFLSLRSQFGQEWHAMQRRFSEIQSAQLDLSASKRALLDDLWHEGPKVFLHGPLEATNWSDSTRSLVGIITNISLLRESESVSLEQRHNFLESISVNAVLVAGKFDQDTFESILSAIDREVGAEPTHLACHAPYTTAQIFCRTLSESYGQYKPTRVTCDVPPLYARQVLHREFRDLANFVLPILIKNAVEALEGSGRRDGQISISLVPEGQEWHVYIKDNGPGLPEDIRNNLFQRGQSSNGEGRGYGLELAHRFIYGTPLFDRASMKLRETSTLGTCFEIILRSPIEIVARGIPEDDFESDE